MTKVISISDDAYACLTKLKEKGESFTDVVIDLAAKEMTKPLSSFAGRGGPTWGENYRMAGKLSNG